MKKKRTTPESRRAQGMTQALDMMKIMSHPLRLSILCALIEHREMSAGEIVERIRAETPAKANQSQISQYLGQLREHGLITGRKEGQFIYYRIGDPRVKKLIALLHDLYCPA